MDERVPEGAASQPVSSRPPAQSAPPAQSSAGGSERPPIDFPQYRPVGGAPAAEVCIMMTGRVAKRYLHDCLQADAAEAATIRRLEQRYAELEAAFEELRAVEDEEELDLPTLGGCRSGEDNYFHVSHLHRLPAIISDTSFGLQKVIRTTTRQALRQVRLPRPGASKGFIETDYPDEPADLNDYPSYPESVPTLTYAWSQKPSHPYNDFAADVFSQMLVEDPDYEAYGFTDDDRPRIKEAFLRQFPYIKWKREQQLKEANATVAIASKLLKAKKERRNNVSRFFRT